MTGFTIGSPKGCQPKWGVAWQNRDRHRKRKRNPLLSVNPQLFGPTVPGSDNMVPLKLLPFGVRAEEIPGKFKQMRIHAIADVEGNAAIVYPVSKVKPRKQPK